MQITTHTEIANSLEDSAELRIDGVPHGQIIDLEVGKNGCVLLTVTSKSPRGNPPWGDAVNIDKHATALSLDAARDLRNRLDAVIDNAEKAWEKA
jgi:hypothetical protein